MHPLFTYEEARKLDALRAAHASDPVHSAFKARRRPVRHAWRWVRERVRRDVVIDLRVPHPPALGRPALAEFLDPAEIPVMPEQIAAVGPDLE